MLSLYFVVDLVFGFLLWPRSMPTLRILECFLYAWSIRAFWLVLVPQLAGEYAGQVVTLRPRLLLPLPHAFLIAALYTTPP